MILSAVQGCKAWDEALRVLMRLIQTRMIMEQSPGVHSHACSAHVMSQ